MWAGVHWTKRKALKDKWRVMTMEATLNKGYKMFQHPVAITVYAYSRRPLDASNVCIKPMEDALIGVVLHDDSPEWVKSLKIHPIKSHEECVVMVLEEVETSGTVQREDQAA